MGGFADENTVLDEVRLATRGGDIVRFLSEDGGASFARGATLKSSPGPWARYSDPQIVSNHPGETDVFFSEWDNDFSNYVEPRPETIVWYVLGADGAVSSAVENTIASLLAE